MRRVHLLEFHDQPWFPGFLRDHVTDALQFLLNFARVDLPIVPRLRRALQETGSRQILDLCSGAGGPWPWLSEPWRPRTSPSTFCLTDKYPHSPASQPASPPGARVRFHREPVDATQVPAELHGFRTIFNSFHHFPPVPGVQHSSGRGRATPGHRLSLRRPAATPSRSCSSA